MYMFNNMVARALLEGRITVKDLLDLGLTGTQVCNILAIYEDMKLDLFCAIKRGNNRTWMSENLRIALDFFEYFSQYTTDDSYYN